MQTVQLQFSNETLNFPFCLVRNWLPIAAYLEENPDAVISTVDLTKWSSIEFDSMHGLIPIPISCHRMKTTRGRAYFGLQIYHLSKYLGIGWIKNYCMLKLRETIDAYPLVSFSFFEAPFFHSYEIQMIEFEKLPQFMQEKGIKNYQYKFFDQQYLIEFAARLEILEIKTNMLDQLRKCSKPEFMYVVPIEPPYKKCTMIKFEFINEIVSFPKHMSIYWMAADQKARPNYFSETYKKIPFPQDLCIVVPNCHSKYLELYLELQYADKIPREIQTRKQLIIASTKFEMFIGCFGLSCYGLFKRVYEDTFQVELSRDDCSITDNMPLSIST